MYPCGLHFVHIYSIFTLISEQFYIFMEPWGLHFVHMPPVFTLISEQFLHRHGSFVGYVMSIYSLYLHYHLNNFYIYVYLWGLYLVHISFYSWHYLNNFYIDYPLVVTLCSYVLCIYTTIWTHLHKAWSPGGYILFIYSQHLHYYLNNFYIYMNLGGYILFIYTLHLLSHLNNFYIAMCPCGYILFIYPLYLHYYLNNFYIGVDPLWVTLCLHTYSICPMTWTTFT